METFAMFSVFLTMLLLGFIVIMLAIAGFCYVVKKLARKGKVGPRVMKWAEVLDWLKEENK